MSSLFKSIGGQPAVEAAVDIFYTKVTTDPAIKGFFQSTDMVGQRGKMKKFLTLLLSGTAENSDQYMRTSHAPLVEKGLNDLHFNAVGGHLKDTLEELNVPGQFIDQILGAVESFRDPVLNR